MSTLYIYSGITPNTTATHYIYATDADYNNMLSNYLVTSVTLDNYRINSNEVYVAFNSSLTASNFMYVTYMRDTLYGAYYYVDSCSIQGGYAVYTVHKDLWSMYYKAATISNIIVNRCNRNIDYGFYDDISVQSQASYSYDNEIATVSTYTKNGGTIPSNLPFVVFYLQEIISGSFDSGITVTNVYAVPMSSFINDHRLTLLNDLYQFVSQYLGGIYCTQDAGASDADPTVDARLIQAFILPKNLIKLSSSVTRRVLSKYATFSAIGGDVFSVEQITKSIEATTTIDPDYDCYFGTYIGDKVKLPRSTQPVPVQVRCHVKPDGVDVVVTSSNIEANITPQFTISCTINDGLYNTTKQISHIIGAVSGVGKTIAGAASSNFLQAGEGAGSIVSIVAGAQNIHNSFGKLASGGSAFQTFMYTKTGDTYRFEPPFVYTSYAATGNEKKRARTTGATFGEYQSSIASIFSYSLLGTGSTNDDTYIQCTCSVTGVPSEARELIQSKLNKGIYITGIQGA